MTIVDNILEIRRKYTFRAFTFSPESDIGESVYIGTSNHDGRINHYNFIFLWDKEKNAIIIVSLREGSFYTDGEIIETIKSKETEPIPILISQRIPKDAQWISLDEMLKEVEL